MPALMRSLSSSPVCLEPGGPHDDHSKCKCALTSTGNFGTESTEIFTSNVPKKSGGPCWRSDPWYTKPPTPTTYTPPPTHTPVLTATVVKGYSETDEVDVYPAMTTTWATDPVGNQHSGLAPSGEPQTLQIPMPDFRKDDDGDIEPDPKGSSMCKTAIDEDQCIKAAENLPEWQLGYLESPGDPNSNWLNASVPFNQEVHSVHHLDNADGNVIDLVSLIPAAALVLDGAPRCQLTFWCDNDDYSKSLTKPQIIQAVKNMYDAKNGISKCGAIPFDNNCIVKTDYCYDGCKRPLPDIYWDITSPQVWKDGTLDLDPVNNSTWLPVVRQG
ncbi:hypothetical protein NUU61_004057 [Penicillium alfredii]|uniref:Uncharacterized protein n=1 Tax=Penicillium alfredii TaxID=1506179 RepID=A0A9W9KCX6_9EURO|nr:uncharacterized protein NUU61_004057 [Penicillium alfredii]KAJ5101835.1 hypothetical protein NUU61_004057 [Penicillium alfredii]